jgi:hypothetical protein
MSEAAVAVVPFPSPVRSARKDIAMIKISLALALFAGCLASDPPSVETSASQSLCVADAPTCAPWTPPVPSCREWSVEIPHHEDLTPALA